MSLLASFMPEYRLREVVRVPVQAPPEQAWRALRQADFSALWYVRWLFALRTLPERLSRWRLREEERPGRMQLEDIVRPGSGFVLLGEEPGWEVVVGSVGKFWRTKIEFAPVSPAAFTGFAAPGYGKLAWNLEVERRHGGGAWLTMDLRVTATDDLSWRRFRWYWLLIGRFSLFLRQGLLRQLAKELGRVPAGPRPRRGRGGLPGHLASARR